MSASAARRIGLLTAEPEPLLIGAAVQVGLDFVVLDAEQTGLDPRRCAEVVRALTGTGADAIVRVPDLHAATLVSYANTGVAELLLPQIRGVAELVAAQQATRYPPVGARSRQVSPASRYGTDFGSGTRLSVLVETAPALDRLDEIAASGLASSVWFGPTDLVDDLARLCPADADRLDELIDNGIATLRRAGVPVGLPAADASGVAAAFARGAQMCSVYWEKCLLATLDGLKRGAVS